MHHWFDPHFDPLQELRECQTAILQLKHNELKLVQSHNQQEAFLADLVNQHNQLLELLKNARREIINLKIELVKIRELNEKPQ